MRGKIGVASDVGDDEGLANVGCEAIGGYGENRRVVVPGNLIGNFVGRVAGVSGGIVGDDRKVVGGVFGQVVAEVCNGGVGMEADVEFTNVKARPGAVLDGIPYDVGIGAGLPGQGNAGQGGGGGAWGE